MQNLSNFFFVGLKAALDTGIRIKLCEAIDELDRRTRKTEQNGESDYGN
jgi:uncharacterized protein YegL